MCVVVVDEMNVFHFATGSLLILFVSTCLSLFIDFYWELFALLHNSCSRKYVHTVWQVWTKKNICNIGKGDQPQCWNPNCSHMYKWKNEEVCYIYNAWPSNRLRCTYWFDIDPNQSCRSPPGMDMFRIQHARTPGESWLIQGSRSLWQYKGNQKPIIFH